jgi:hypothetical protein
VSDPAVNLSSILALLRVPGVVAVTVHRENGEHRYEVNKADRR